MISMIKKYTTRDGRAVRLLCTDAPSAYPVVALIGDDGNIGAHSFTATGEFIQGQIDEIDLIEAVPFADFKIDDPVMVSSSDQNAVVRRHFAGIDEFGQPTAWDEGLTSWTNIGATSWSYCRRPTPEELAE